jgi:hypothetical protein
MLEKIGWLLSNNIHILGCAWINGSQKYAIKSLNNKIKYLFTGLLQINIHI